MEAVFEQAAEGPCAGGSGPDDVLEAAEQAWAVSLLTPRTTEPSADIPVTVSMPLIGADPVEPSTETPGWSRSLLGGPDPDVMLPSADTATAML